MHGSTFGVRSLIFNLFGEGFDKESAVLTLVSRDILNGNRLDCVSLFPVLVVDLLILLTVCPRTLIKMTRDYKELLSSLHRQHWLKPPI